jgi:hypothetical protein
MPLEPLYDLVIFLRLDAALRMERLRRREIVDYGARVGPGGDMEAASRQFFEWAAAYDSAGLEQMRSLATHELWLTKQRCSVQRLDAAAPVKDLVVAVLAKLSICSRSEIGQNYDVQTVKRRRQHLPNCSELPETSDDAGLRNH